MQDDAGLTAALRQHLHCADMVGCSRQNELGKDTDPQAVLYQGYDRIAALHPVLHMGLEAQLMHMLRHDDGIGILRQLVELQIIQLRLGGQADVYHTALRPIHNLMAVPQFQLVPDIGIDLAECFQPWGEPVAGQAGERADAQRAGQDMPDLMELLLAAFVAFFMFFASRMGVMSAINTLMNTAYALLIDTVLYLTALCVLMGLLGAVIGSIVSTRIMLPFTTKMLGREEEMVPRAPDESAMHNHMRPIRPGSKAGDCRVGRRRGHRGIHAMCMCWSGYLSTHVSMMNDLNCNQLINKAIINRAAGGLRAGRARNLYGDFHGNMADFYRRKIPLLYHVA